MFVKIINLLDDYGNANYKGLNRQLVIPGSQIYDFGNNLCVLKTTEENISNSNDVSIINEQEYNSLKAEIENKNMVNEPTSIENRISALEVAMAQQLGM